MIEKRARPDDTRSTVAVTRIAASCREAARVHGTEKIRELTTASGRELRGHGQDQCDCHSAHQIPPPRTESRSKAVSSTRITSQQIHIGRRLAETSVYMLEISVGAHDHNGSGHILRALISPSLAATCCPIFNNTHRRLLVDCQIPPVHSES